MDTMCQNVSVLTGVCSGSEEGKFEGRTCAQKNVSCCLLLLQIETLTTTVSDSHHYSNYLLQGGLKDHLLHFSYMAIPLAEACAVIINSTLIKVNF